MLTLSLNQPFASIANFPKIELPDFTLITGPNGSGKSHLLQAISNGSIQADLPSDPRVRSNGIVLRDWSSMVPRDEGAFHSNFLQSERNDIFKSYIQVLRGAAVHHEFEALRSVLRTFGVVDSYASDPIKALTEMDQVEAALEVERLTDFRAQFSNARQELELSVIRGLTPVHGNVLRWLAKTYGQSFLALTRDQILSSDAPAWGATDMLQQSFARLFVTYRDLKFRNELAQFRASKGASVTPLTDEVFVQRYGDPPWELVNRALTAANLDFCVGMPPNDELGSFELKLMKRSSGAELSFSQLSSGEQILMSLAFCAYYYDDERQLCVRPGLLLLDEIDAPLHPSMSRSMLDVIVSVLVARGIKVIATTHSPSTVALAPEEALYTMTPDKPGLHKSSKAHALNTLTAGVPTIAISYEGRRQVFVESPFDAAHYTELYALLRPRLNSERSLEFIATGTKRLGGTDINTGCDAVKRLVSDLAEAGNTSVFGLLDWDAKHQPSERVCVLAHGSRNGLENVLLDPLLLAITICREPCAEKQRLGLGSDVSYSRIRELETIELQALVSKVTECMFGDPPQTTKPSKYVGGMELQIDERCFLTDDHILEEMALKTFPVLRSISKRSGKLKEHVITVILADNPDFMPLEIVSAMLDLLTRPAHV